MKIISRDMRPLLPADWLPSAKETWKIIVSLVEPTCSWTLPMPTSTQSSDNSPLDQVVSDNKAR